ncbi:MAG: WecB/TagA/CpsF family glycosyltransferase [Chlorobium limicola]|uniref:WecB/TagA/CpsF family glycosyltransferase n=1 Tax=Chlorobium limicola TaxID=1092 RepID=UPI0023F0C1E2|nr:WecB/TagA/CpsF family glycosyltransferase [Chlorobium limicola]NTV20919.1 WecB/TagA/CpsF family glycosyltransferase [Chlorobium limicola]
MTGIPDCIHDQFRLGCVSLSTLNRAEALSYAAECSENGRGGYICFMDARTAYLANHDRDYCDIQCNSLLTLPDGMPLVWFAHLLGYGKVEKVSGKDFMDHVFSCSVRQKYSHFFYGSTPETIERIRKNLERKYPGMLILGAVSPPFQPLEAFDIDALADELNRLKPAFFWCGLGAPKQERLMALLQPKLDATICAGVGLAFEYFSGTVRRAPLWMQRSGFEWLYRLAQQPRNISRVIRPFSWIARELLLAKMKRNKGK